MMIESADLDAPSRDPAAEQVLRVFSLRWPDGREEHARGSTPAAAILSLGYGFDDFKNLTWEEQA